MENDKFRIGTTDLAQRFEIFRKVAEENVAKCKTLQLTIEQLQEEVNTARTIEKNTRTQLVNCQERILKQQLLCNQLLCVREQNLAIQAVTEKVQETNGKIFQELQESKQKLQIFLQTISKEKELTEENKSLKELIRKKDADYDLANMELQTMKKENQIKITELMDKNRDDRDKWSTLYEEKITRLKDHLKEVEAENVDVKSHSERALSTYRKLLTEHEQTIERYEQERTFILGQSDFNSKKQTSILKKSYVQETDTKKSVTWNLDTPTMLIADSTSQITNDTNTEVLCCDSYPEINSTINVGLPSEINTEDDIIEDEFDKMSRNMRLMTPLSNRFKRIGFKYKEEEKHQETPKKRKLYTPPDSDYFLT